MIKKQLTSLIKKQLTSSHLKKAVKAFPTVFGILGGIASLIGVFVSLIGVNNVALPAIISSIPDHFIFTIICAFFATFIISWIFTWQKSKVTYQVTGTTLTIEVSACNIFETDGTRVIHCVDTFDTALDDGNGNGIIKPRSVYGQFLSLPPEGEDNVATKIQKKLKNIKKESKDPNLPGNKDRYPIGTICDIQYKETDYCVVAFNHLKSGKNVVLEPMKINDYENFWDIFWEKIKTINIDIGQPLNITLMGNNFTDMPNIETRNILGLIIEHIYKANVRFNHIRICISDKDFEHIDFSEVPFICDYHYGQFRRN